MPIAYPNRSRAVNCFSHTRFYFTEEIHRSLVIWNWIDQFVIFIRKIEWAASHNKDGHQKWRFSFPGFDVFEQNEFRMNESRSISLFELSKRTDSFQNHTEKWWSACADNSTTYGLVFNFFVIRFILYFRLYCIETVNRLFIGHWYDKQIIPLFVDTVMLADWVAVLSRWRWTHNTHTKTHTFGNDFCNCCLHAHDCARSKYRSVIASSSGLPLFRDRNVARMP